MSLFDKFLQSNDDIIKEAANLADQATIQYNSQQITLGEYKELCNDILDYQKVVALVTDMVRRQIIWDAFQAIGNVVNTVSGI